MNRYRFNWSAVIAGAAVAVATAFFLTVLGAGFGLTLMPARAGAAFFTLGAIYLLAAQAFGFVAGGHVTGRLIGPALESKKEEEWRAGLAWPGDVGHHGCRQAWCCWPLVAAGGGPRLHGDAPRSESSIASLLGRYSAAAHGPACTRHAAKIWRRTSWKPPGCWRQTCIPAMPAHAANRDDLIRLTAMDAGGSFEATSARVDFVEAHMRRGDGHGAQGRRLCRAVDRACRCCSARCWPWPPPFPRGWEDDKISFSMARRY